MASVEIGSNRGLTVNSYPSDSRFNAFILNDPTPRPDRIDARGVQLLDMQSLGLRTRANLVCKP